MIEIHEYIAYVLMSPDAASRQLEGLMKAVRTLENLPNRFAMYELEPWRKRGLRVFPVDKYLIFYVVDDLNVFIVRIMYGGRDISKQLSQSD